MGFSEYDRIRQKNRFHNEAFKIYEDLKAIGYSNNDVLRYANFALSSSSDSYRNEIFKTLISILGRMNERDSDK